MKKIIAFSMILSMTVLFTGCKNQNGVCRWSPFKRDQTVCYTPCNTCDIPVVDDCFSCGTTCGTPVVSDCASCTVGTPTVVTSPATPVIEPMPGN